MIRQAVEMVASFIDNVTAPFRATSDGVKGIANDMAEGFTKSLKDMGVAIAEFFAAEKLLEFFKGAVEASAKAELSIGNLRQAVNNAGQTFSDWSPKIQDALDRVKKLSTFTDADLRDALTHMIAKSGDVQGSLDHLGMAADIAAYKHISLAEAGDLVGKAMTGNGRVFKDFGITAGTTAEKMQQLSEKTRGYAEEDLNTMDGRLKAVGRSWDEMKVKIGDAIVTQGGAKDGTKELMQAIEDVTPVLVAVATFFVKLFVGIVNGVKGVGTEWAFNLAMWKSQVEMFVGNAIVTFATLGDKALGWIPGIGKGVSAAAAAAIEVGGNMVADAIMIQGNLAAAVKEGEEAQTATVTDQAHKRTAAISAEDEKRMKAQQAAMKAAGDAVSTETASLLQEQKKLTDQWEKDFGDVMPKVVGETKAKINDLGTEVDTLKLKQADFAAKAQAAYRDNQQEAGDMYNAEIGKIGEVIDQVNAQKGAYERILPIYTMLGTLANDVTKAESDPNPYTRLSALNGLLAQQVNIRDTLAEGSREALEADKEIAQTKKDIRDTETLTLTPATGLKELEKENEDSVKRQIRLYNERMAAEQRRRDINAEIIVQTGAIAEAAGLVDANFTKALDSCVGIAQSLAKGDTVGAIAGLGGILVSVFGESPENAARKALIQKNNQVLADLVAVNGKIVNQNDSGAKLDAIRSALNSSGIAGGDSSSFGSSVGTLAGAVHTFTMAGVSESDLESIAKEYGIDLGTTAQQRLAGLQSLSKFLNSANFQTFDTTTYAGQLSQAQFNEGLTGGNLSLADYQGLATGSAGSSALAALFANGTPSLSAVQALAARINSLSNAELGGMSRQQFADALTGIAGLIPPPVTATTGASASTSSGVSASYVPPSTSTYTPTNTSGVSFDLSPVVDAITSGFATANGYLANIDRSTAATAEAVTDGTFVRQVGEAVQRGADIASASTGG